MTGVRFEHDNYYEYDIREPPRKVVHPDRVPTKKLATTTDDWSHIPYYPTTEERKQLVIQHGQPVAEQIIKNTYNSRKTLYEKNKKDFENKLANILSST
jgi:hypothetical protein